MVPRMISLQSLKYFLAHGSMSVWLVCVVWLSTPKTCFPLVILDSPTGMSSDVWLHVQENVAKITKVRKWNNFWELYWMALFWIEFIKNIIFSYYVKTSGLIRTEVLTRGFTEGASAYLTKENHCGELSLESVSTSSHVVCCQGHIGTVLAVALPHPLCSTRTQYSRKSGLTACPMLFVWNVTQMRSQAS